MNVAFVWVVSNSLVAAAIAIFALFAGRVCRSPQTAHGLWVLVLVKLITPPIYPVAINAFWLADQEDTALEKTIDPPLARDERSFAPEDSPVENVPPREPAASAGPLTSAREPDKTNLPQGATDIKDNLASANDDRVAVPDSKILSKPSTGVSPKRAAGVNRLILLVWFCGGSLLIVRYGFRLRRIRKLFARCIPADRNIVAETSRLANQMGVSRPPQVFVVDLPISPLVLGNIRPRILLPSGLIEKLTLAEQQTVLVHELAHIRRRDHWVRWLEAIPRVLFWWNPLVWFACRELRRAEEACCDAWVVWTLPGLETCYGRALYATVQFLNQAPPLPSMTGTAMSGRRLKERIQTIMKETPNPRISLQSRICIGLAAMIVLPVAAQTTPTQSEPQRSSDTQSARSQPASSDDHNAHETLPESDPSAPLKNLAGGESPATATAKTDRDPAEKTEQPALEGVHRSARLKPSADLKVSSLHAGTVETIAVKAGENVKRGQTLLTLKNTELEFQLEEARAAWKVQEQKVKIAEASLEVAQAKADAAKSNLNRLNEINHRAAGSVPEAALAEAKEAREQAELIVETTRRELRSAQAEEELMKKRAVRAAQKIEELKTKAPRDGIAVEILRGQAEPVAANAPLIRLVSISPLIAESSVKNPQGILGKTVQVVVQRGDRGDKRLSAKVVFVSPLVEPISETFRIRCSFENKGPDDQPVVFPGERCYMIVPQD